VTDVIWFSAMAVFVVRVGVRETGETRRNLYLVRAGSFPDAHAAAIVRARRDERTYKNADDETVEWVLAGIETLDWLGETIIEGREVYSEPGIVMPIPTGALRFHPDRFEPTQTGV